MTGCQATCTGADQRAFRIAMTRTIVVACAEHAAYLEGQGLTLIPVDRRVATVPVVTDRRARFVAAWRRHLTARDETGALR